MPAVFLDYATVSFDGDLDPRSLHAALPGLEISDHTAQQDVASRVAGREVVLVNKLRITREIIEATSFAAADSARCDRHEQRGPRGSRVNAASRVCNLRDYCTRLGRAARASACCCC